MPGASASAVASPNLASLEQWPDSRRAEHVAEALRVLALPIAVSGLHWHPFGVFTIPLAKRTRPDGVWSRRLHIWHPAGKPVGPASAYGVHSHTGDAVSHVLAGRVVHHLYAFTPDPDDTWVVNPGDGRVRLVAHVQGETVEGQSHGFPADHAHGVSKDPAVFAISLFEQRDGTSRLPFTTWQQTDVPAEELVRRAPVPLADVQREALLLLSGLGADDVGAG